MPEPKEKDFVGIDPVSLKAMNDDLANVRVLLRSQLGVLRKAFGTASVPTTAIDRLAAVGTWIDQELPMLRRRQAMAAQLQKESLQLGQNSAMVSTDWAGNFPSAQAAIARANELAGRYKEPGELPDEVWEEVRNNQNDPDFAAAFAKALGPHDGRMLAANLSRKTAPPERLQVLGNLFATASHQKTFDDSWFPKFPAVPGILPLMRFGNWDNDLLVRVGQIALDSNVIASDSVRVADVLEVVARSPIAASRLYQDNFEKIQAMSRGRSVGWTNGDDPKLSNALGTFIRSATVDARNVYEALRPAEVSQWPNPAEDLTRRLLMDLASNPTRAAFRGVQAAYMTIATEFYDDLQAAIAGPPLPSYFNQPDPGRPGVEVPAAAWSALVQQAMWDPKNAALLSTFFRAKYEASISAVNRADIPNAPDANSLTSFQSGQIRGWYVHQLNTVKSAAAAEVADYNAKVKQWVDYFVDPANAAIFANPVLPELVVPSLGIKLGTAATATGMEAGKKAAEAAGKTITGFVKDNGVGSVKEKIISWFDREPPVYTTDDAWTDDTQTWREMAENMRGLRSIKPVTDRYGTTWSGQPGYYEKLYGAKFTAQDGTTPSLEDIPKLSPPAQRAYAAWLQDPAVQQAVWNEAEPNILGRQSK
jgi:hypothetical protein